METLALVIWCSLILLYLALYIILHCTESLVHDCVNRASQRVGHNGFILSTFLFSAVMCITADLHVDEDENMAPSSLTLFTASSIMMMEVFFFSAMRFSQWGAQ